MTVTAPLGEALDTAPAVPEPDPVAESTGVGALALAVIAGLLAVLAGLGTKWVLRRVDRHHAPRLGLPGQAPGEQTRVGAAELAGLATPSSRLPGDLTPSQGAVLLANNDVNLWSMADWVAEQAAAGTVGLQAPDDSPDDDEAKKSVVLVRRQDGEGFAKEVLDTAFGGRERITLGRYDRKFARASTMVKGHLGAWRESSGLWDQTLARRAKLAKRLGLVAGLGGSALAVVGASLASTAGTAAFILAGGGAALAVAGFCVASRSGAGRCSPRRGRPPGCRWSPCGGTSRSRTRTTTISPPTGSASTRRGHVSPRGSRTPPGPRSSR